MAPRSKRTSTTASSAAAARSTPARAAKPRGSRKQHSTLLGSSNQPSAAGQAAISASATASDSESTSSAFAPPRQAATARTPTIAAVAKADDEPTTPIQAPVTRVSKSGKVKHEPGTITDNGQLWTDEIDSALLEAMRLIPNIQRRTVEVDGQELGRNALLSEFVFRKTGWFRSKRQIGSHLQLLKKHNEGNAQVMDLLRDHAIEDEAEFDRLVADIGSILGKPHPNPHIPQGFDVSAAHHDSRKKTSEADLDDHDVFGSSSRDDSKSPIKVATRKSGKTPAKPVIKSGKTPARQNVKRKAGEEPTPARKKTRTSAKTESIEDIDMGNVAAGSVDDEGGTPRRRRAGRPSTASSLRKSASMGALAAKKARQIAQPEDSETPAVPTLTLKRSQTRSAPASPAKSINKGSGRGRGRKSIVAVTTEMDQNTASEDDEADPLSIDTTEAPSRAFEQSQAIQSIVPEQTGWLAQAKQGIRNLFGF
ncbi:hypothetical protein OIV83_004610 [Microbotryomycetes sp. JL201]|nr:hypothetical protein OIV83_004610 [Microbotryomycetes sp. JL201]